MIFQFSHHSCQIFQYIMVDDVFHHIGSWTFSVLVGLCDNIKLHWKYPVMVIAEAIWRWDQCGLLSADARASAGRQITFGARLAIPKLRQSFA